MIDEPAAPYTCVPTSHDYTCLSDDALTFAIGLRLETQVASPGVRRCNALLDSLGDHVLSCKGGLAGCARHTAVKECMRTFLANAKCVAALELPRLHPDTDRWPDCIIVLPFDGGRPLAWNATFIHTCTSSHTLDYCANRRCARTITDCMRIAAAEQSGYSGNAAAIPRPTATAVLTLWYQICRVIHPYLLFTNSS